MAGNGTDTVDTKLDQVIADVKRLTELIEALSELTEAGLADNQAAIENLAEGGMGMTTFES